MWWTERVHASWCVQEIDTGYRKIWDFGRTWDPDAYAAQPRSLSEIRRDLVLQRNWKASLDRMKTNMAVGCLQVERLDSWSCFPVDMCI